MSLGSALVPARSDMRAAVAFFTILASAHTHRGWRSVRNRRDWRNQTTRQCTSCVKNKYTHNDAPAQRDGGPAVSFGGALANLVKLIGLASEQAFLFPPHCPVGQLRRAVGVARQHQQPFVHHTWNTHAKSFDTHYFLLMLRALCQI